MRTNLIDGFNFQAELEFCRNKSKQSISMQTYMHKYICIYMQSIVLHICSI